MHLVNLSLDRSIFSTQKIGDTHHRFVAYAKGADSFTVLVPFVGKAKRKKVDGIEYIPAQASHSIGAYGELFQRLRTQLQLHPTSIIVCNDPVLGFLAVLLKPFYPQARVQINSFGTRINDWAWMLERPHHLGLWLVSLVSLIACDSIRTDTTKDAQILSAIPLIASRKIITAPVPPSEQIQKQLLKLPLKKNFASPVRLLAIGSLTANKDFTSLIKALAQVSSSYQWQLHLVGSGPQERELKSLASQLSLDKQIEFIPNLDYAALMKQYDWADIFVSSSVREGLPRVLMEASLAGIPMVTTNFNGAGDLISHPATGLIVSKQDHLALAKALEKTMKNPSQAFSRAASARRRAKAKLSFKASVDLLQQSWQSLARS